MRKFLFAVAIVTAALSAHLALSPSLVMAQFKEPNLQLPVAQGGYAFQALRPGTTYNLEYGATSISNAGTLGAEVVRVVCNTDCVVAIGSLPTAVNNDGIFMPTDYVGFFRVISGTDKIAVVQHISGAGGWAHITEMK